MKATTRIFQSCLAVALGILFLGCAGSGSDQAVQLSPTGQHAAGFVNTHYIDYAKNPDQCATCHGSTTDPASTGGTSKISCFSCHGSAGAAHPDGWSAGLSHGRLGAQQAASTTTGMASCGRCHGTDLTGGIAAVSCQQCHTKAPHPDRPWLSGNPNTSVSHDATNVSNAPECFKCHANGANSTLLPTPPAPAGTTPGCYNNTMCHDNTFG